MSTIIENQPSRIITWIPCILSFDDSISFRSPSVVKSIFPAKKKKKKKRRSKKRGWSVWGDRVLHQIQEKVGKFGSKNLVVEKHLFLRYRSGSMTHFRNQANVVQFCCCNRKRHSCLAVVERAELFRTGEVKYRINHNVHSESCRAWREFKEREGELEIVIEKICNLKKKKKKREKRGEAVRPEFCGIQNQIRKDCANYYSSVALPPIEEVFPGMSF